MKYIKNHPYCIEERAKKFFGETEIFEFAGYLLEDGTMLNFSHEGYQRDEDHRVIGEFYSKASGTEALCKFMRRGNIRCSCNSGSFCFEFSKFPTKKQWQVLYNAARLCQLNQIEFYLENEKHNLCIRNRYDLENYLKRKEKTCQIINTIG